MIVEPSYGYLLLQYIGDDATLSGSLNKEYFCEEMIEDIVFEIYDGGLRMALENEKDFFEKMQEFLPSTQEE